MQRRSFIETLGGLSMLGTLSSAGAAAEQKTRFYSLQNFYLKNGTQMGRINDFMSKSFLPALNRIQPRPVLCLEALVAQHMPQFALLMGFGSLEEFQSLSKQLYRQEGFPGSVETWEAGSEAPYEHYSLSLLEATPYSPEIQAPDAPPKAPRIFEIRTYHSPTWRQLKALHERFAGSEIQIFHRSGVHPILYSSTMVGADMPNLTYVIPFQDLAAREKAWAAFGADPEWVKVRKESIDKHGQISSVSRISLFRATSYSPIR